MCHPHFRLSSVVFAEVASAVLFRLESPAPLHLAHHHADPDSRLDPDSCLLDPYSHLPDPDPLNRDQVVQRLASVFPVGHRPVV
jgi:hypothetical protein